MKVLRLKRVTTLSSITRLADRWRKFDSNKDRNDPFEFPLGRRNVIAGWDEGVQGMKIGGTRKLTIPAELGYGARGAGGVIPPECNVGFRG